MSDPSIKAKFDRPIIFRTCDRQVYESTLSTGSIWLRSSYYYRKIEDVVRQDRSEGINGTQALTPLKFKLGSKQTVSIEGSGSIGQEIILHYIISMHGVNITEKVRQEFGGYTLGVKCIADLAAEIVYKASQIVPVTGYRYGQVAYQRTALSMSYEAYGSALQLGGNPPVYIKSINTDVLRKDPTEPFISQDEWRVAIFTNAHFKDDWREPLKINVGPSHFYRYIEL